VELLQLCVEAQLFYMAASASITESVVSVRHQILVCLVVADVVSPTRLFLCVPVIAALVKGWTAEEH